jgi:hypothetical protein
MSRADHWKHLVIPTPARHGKTRLERGRVKQMEPTPEMVMHRAAACGAKVVLLVPGKRARRGKPEAVEVITYERALSLCRTLGVEMKLKTSADLRASIEPLDILVRRGDLTPLHGSAGVGFRNLHCAVFGPSTPKSASANMVHEHIGGRDFWHDSPEEREAARWRAWKGATTAIMAHGSRAAFNAVWRVCIEGEPVARRQVVYLRTGLTILVRRWRIE